MKKIYVAHPFNNDITNTVKIECIIKDLVKTDPDSLFVSPVHLTGFYYDRISYMSGMEKCLTLLDVCDELLLCGDWESSVGCKMEWAFAKGKGIPITLHA